jgi:hypothetical protein
VSPSSLGKRERAGPNAPLGSPAAKMPRSSHGGTTHLGSTPPSAGTRSSSNPAMTGPRPSRASVPSLGADGASPHTPLRSPGSNRKPRKTVPDWPGDHNSICEKPGCGQGGKMFECRCCNVVYHLKCVSQRDREFLSRDSVDNLWECPKCWIDTLRNDRDPVMFPTLYHVSRR